jgi:hypothetical protein
LQLASTKILCGSHAVAKAGLRVSSLLVATAHRIEISMERCSIPQLCSFWVISNNNLTRDVTAPHNRVWFKNFPAPITLLPIGGTIDLDQSLGHDRLRDARTRQQEKPDRYEATLRNHIPHPTLRLSVATPKLKREKAKHPAKPDAADPKHSEDHES